MEKENQKKVWNSLAGQWTNFRQRPFKDVTTEIETLIKRKRKGKILEIGCGNCRNLLPFAKKGFDCYGIDFSSNMLREAEKYSRKYGFKVNLQEAKAEKLPFDNNSFDYVLNIAVLHHLKKKQQEKAIKEMYRVLKTKGIGFVSVWNKFPLSLFKKNKYEKWTKKGKVYKRYCYLFTTRELKRLLKKQGFKILKSESGKNISVIIGKP